MDPILPPEPPHDRETLDELPAANDTLPPPAAEPPPESEFGQPEFLHTLPEYVPPLVIPKGQAQFAFQAALADLLRAVELVEATGMACARQIDLQADQETP